MKKVAVILSGCGVFDGSEIHEACAALLALHRHGAQAVACAPDIAQMHVIDHAAGEPAAGESRNVARESARLVRGEITPLADMDPTAVDAVLLPGGFGAAKNLSDFAFKGKDARVREDVAALVNAMVGAGKPVGAICIAPAMVAKALEGKNPEVTIGSDEGTARAIEEMGGAHRACTVDMIHVDEKNRVVTTPAYMLGPGIKDVAEGIEKLVEKVLAMI